MGVSRKQRVQVKTSHRALITRVEAKNQGWFDAAMAAEALACKPRVSPCPQGDTSGNSRLYGPQLDL